jgi:hypothetical protein
MTVPRRRRQRRPVGSAKMGRFMLKYIDGRSNATAGTPVLAAGLGYISAWNRIALAGPDGGRLPPPSSW